MITSFPKKFQIEYHPTGMYFEALNPLHSKTDKIVTSDSINPHLFVNIVSTK